MYRTANVSIYDMMGQIHAHAVIHTYEQGEEEERHNETTECSVFFPSKGQDNDERWLLDALVALAESL